MVFGITGKVCFIGSVREFIPFAGKYTKPALLFKAFTDTTNPCEQVDKAEFFSPWYNRLLGKKFLESFELAVAEFRLSLTFYPTVKGFSAPAARSSLPGMLGQHNDYVHQAPAASTCRNSLIRKPAESR